VEALLELQREVGGAGLAAPQAGYAIRVAVSDPLVLINPEIIDRSEETMTLREGCISIPGFHGFIERSRRVRVRARDVDGGWREFDAEDGLAVIVQHELDHLDGVLYPDLLPEGEELRRSEAPRTRRRLSVWRRARSK